MTRKMNNNKKRGTVSSATFIEDESLPETLNDVLHNSELRRDFRSYLRARFADESLFFYENIELYEQIDDHRYDARQKAGKLILNNTLEVSFLVAKALCS